MSSLPRLVRRRPLTNRRRQSRRRRRKRRCRPDGNGMRTLQTLIRGNYPTTNGLLLTVPRLVRRGSTPLQKRYKRKARTAQRRISGRRRQLPSHFLPRNSPPSNVPNNDDEGTVTPNRGTYRPPAYPPLPQKTPNESVPSS